VRPFFKQLSENCSLRVFFGLLFISTFAWCQDFRASLTGTVTDPSGGAVGGALLVAESAEQGTRVDVTTNSAGRFTFTRLTPGIFRLTIQKSGFRTEVVDKLELRASSIVEAPVRLEPGTVSDSITVEGKAPGLDTESASRTGAVDPQILENVPSGGRNGFALEYSVPGVVKTSPYWGAMELYATSNVNNVQIGGGRANENETLVDGTPATRTDRGIAYVPPLASIGELVVNTNAYDAQYGRTGGGITSILLKSGTNQLHGQLYEFFKNDKIRANDWLANKEGEASLPFKNNTFGFELDAPVVIPKLFNGRNRLFFLLSFEGLREHSAGGQLTTMPSAAMRQGDFSQLRNGAGSQVVIYDPLSARLQVNGQYLRQPLAGNVIPPSRINPVAAKAAAFYPLPNLQGDGPAALNNYAKVAPAINGYDAWLGKLDFAIDRQQRLAVRYGQTPWQNLAGLVWGDNAAEPSTSYPATRVQRDWSADWIYTPGSTLVVNVRAGLARYEAFRGNSFGANFDPAQLGFPASFVGQLSTLEFPRFTLGQYSDLGANGVRSYEAHDTWSLEPSLSWASGRHLIRAGADFRIYRDNSQQPGAASGTYGFNKAWTQADPLRADAASGNEFASFLMGYAASASVPLNIDPAFQSRYYAVFAADDFKAAKNVTLSYGLRWSYETPYVERHYRMITGFGFDQRSPIADQVAGLDLKGGLLFAGKNGSRYPFDAKPWNFEPRAGVAWHVAQHWVVRGGYGLTTLGQSSAGPQSGFSQTTTMVTSLDGNITPAANLSDPFPSALFPTGLLKPIGSSLGLATNLGQAVTAPWRDRPLPYSQQYSAGIQRELRGGWVVEVAYQGNLTRRLPVSLGLNFIPLNALQAVPVDQRTAYFNAAVPNPMAGLLPGTSLNGAMIPRQQLLVAFPQYSSVTITDVPIGRQRYDSLLLKATRRFSRGLSLTASFAAPKTLEQVSLLNAQDVDVSHPLNTRLEKRLTQFDVSRQFSVIGTWDVPFQSGRRWLNRTGRGWTVSGFFMSHTGFPLDFPNAAPLAARSARLSDDQRDALARAAGRDQFDVSVDKWYDVTLFPGTVGPAPFTLRTFPTRFPDVRTKPLNVLDMSIYREFRVREKVRYQVRVDAHNAGNFPWFGAGLSNNVTNAGFGQLKADMGNEARTMVAVMKVLF
jgi:hypothetical protein